MKATASQPRRPRWHLVYYLLAAFDIVTVSGSLYLNHQIMAIYSGSVDVNQQWATRLAGFSTLGHLAISVNAPGNDVFDTREVDGELAKRDSALRTFRRQLELTSQEIAVNVPPAMAEPLLSGLSAIERAMAAMTSEADLIFSYFRANETGKAGRRMATMDRKYADVNIQLAQAAAKVRAIQANHFKVQVAEAAFLRRFEVLIAGFIILMVGFVTLYGHKIAKEMKSVEEEKQRNLNALEENERTLRDSEEKSRAVVDGAMDGIVTIDGDGIVRSFNRAAERIFGFGHEDVIGRNFANLVPESTATLHDRLNSAGFAESGLKNADQVKEVVATKKDGTNFPAELSVTQMSIRGKAMFTCLVRDITARKRDHERRSALEAQLRQSQKMESLGTLAGGIAHEFNNMLVPMIGLTELAVTEVPEQSKTRQNLEMVLESGLRASQLVEKILSFSHINAAEHRPMDLHDVIAGAIKLLEVTSPATVSLRLDTDIDVGMVKADATQIQQVLLNMASNAVHAMDGKVGELTIGLSRVELGEAQGLRDSRFQPGAYAKLSISDTGKGMDEETKQRIFDPFYTTKEVGEGTGMGLAITHGIITAHGGVIRVLSGVGVGTTFEIFLPIHQADLEDTQSEFVTQGT